TAGRGRRRASRRPRGPDRTDVGSRPGGRRDPRGPRAARRGADPAARAVVRAVGARSSVACRAGDGRGAGPRVPELAGSLGPAGPRRTAVSHGGTGMTTAI